MNPAFVPTYWSYQYVLGFVGKRCVHPPLGLLTVASLLPSHWRPRLVDLNVEELDDRTLRAADVVLLTGMHCQRRSLHHVLRRCRRLGVPTVVGGPYATTEPYLLDDADHLVLGESEDTLGPFCAALEAGQAPRITRNADFPDLGRAPIPRYDLLRRGAYYNMSVQFSRGCPFSCEFCDIIVVYGRRPRTKTAAQVGAELDAIRETGFRGSVFFVDDNFIGNRKAVRRILPEIEAWQARHGSPFDFYTEASLDLADDVPLMQAMTRAGFWSVFVGIESPSAEALREMRKTQNLGGDMVGRIHAIVEQGLDVWGGFIVGFDSDGPDVFDRHAEFVEQAGIPDAMVGLLQAIPGTPLEARLRAAGRLRHVDSVDQFGRTNFTTVLSEPLLVRGYQRLLGTLYDPKRYFGRVLALMRRRPPLALQSGGLSPRKFLAAVRAIGTQGVLSGYRREYWRFLRHVWRWDRSRLPEAILRAASGHHFIEYTRRDAIPALEEPIAATGVPTPRALEPDACPPQTREREQELMSPAGRDAGASGSPKAAPAKKAGARR